MPDPPTPFSNGLLDGRYEFIELAGEGGMAFVYRCKEILLERPGGVPLAREVAVKVPKTAPDPADVAMYERRIDKELRRLAGIEHPNIIQILNAGVCEGMPYLVLQHLPGGTLTQKLKRMQALEEAMTATAISEWLHPIAGALDYLHKKSIYHRDVKPSNVLFGESESAYLADFGISMIDTGSKRRTTASQHMVTYAFCAPEEIFPPPRPIQQSDQYSLAATIYWCLSNRYTHVADQDFNRRKRSEQATHIQTHVPELSDESSRALMRALSRDPAERFETCQQFADRFAGGTSGRSLHPYRRPETVRSGTDPPTVSEVVPSPPPIDGFSWKETVSSDVHIYVHGQTNLEFALIHGGVFLMGSPTSETGRRMDEVQHEVELSPYLIAREPCTWLIWKELMDSPKSPALGGGLTPAVRISWKEAKRFCEQAGLDLPTEAQWEFACRAEREESHLEDLTQCCWFNKNSGGRIHPIREMNANGFGLFDMLGGVSEWCLDRYGPYDLEDRLDPMGPTKSPYRVNRGGSCLHGEHECRPSSRQFCTPDTALDVLGFRPAKNLR